MFGIIWKQVLFPYVSVLLVYGKKNSRQKTIARESMALQGPQWDG